jgi:hypothetical protein
VNKVIQSHATRKKTQRNKKKHKTLNRKHKKKDLENVIAYITLPLYIKQYLNYTIMHLSTTTKNKLQRIKYNKVETKINLELYLIFCQSLNSNKRSFPTPCHLQENQHLWTKIKLLHFILHACIVF